MGLKSTLSLMGRKVLPERLYKNFSQAYIGMEAYLARLRHARAFKKKGSRQIRIVFLVYGPQGWNSLKTVFRAAVASENVKAYLVVSPEMVGGRPFCRDEVFEYFAAEDREAINAYQDEKLFDLKTLRPDVVFRQTPYDPVYPKQYYAKKIARYSKLCYVPYNFNFSPKKHLEIEYNPWFMMDLFAAFEESTSNYRHCMTLKESLYPDLHVYNLGFPRFDLLRNIDGGHEKDARSFAWIPRWSVDSVNNDASNFFNYVDKLIEYFGKHQDSHLVIRPHQNMFNNFVKLGLMTEGEVSAFRQYIAGLQNVELDESFDYMPLIANSDALIADHSSLVFEFYLTAKPIIYCGDPREFNAETARMMELIYKAANWNELEDYIDMLRAGKDDLYCARKEDAQSLLDAFPENVGESIVKQCVEFCR